MLITEFANNNIVFLNIDLSFFYINKSFNSRIFYNFDNIEYIIVREKFKIIKVEDINNIMQRILKYMQQNFYKTREVMFKQINKYKKKINYELNDRTFLFSRNIIIDRYFKKFKNKILKLVSIEEKIEVFYQLQLFYFIKIYDIFYFHLMRKNSNDFLFKQV